MPCCGINVHVLAVASIMLSSTAMIMVPLSITASNEPDSKSDMFFTSIFMSCQSREINDIRLCGIYCRGTQEQKVGNKDHTFKLRLIVVFLLHLLNYHRRYIDVDNILITIIDHVFTKYCDNQKKINHISNSTRSEVM